MLNLVNPRLNNITDRDHTDDVAIFDHGHMAKPALCHLLKHRDGGIRARVFPPENTMSAPIRCVDNKPTASLTVPWGGIDKIL